MQGLTHIYCGDGKGKTTASVGLAIRAAGAGKKVLFVQFFKDGSSSELTILKNLEQVTVSVCTTYYGFFKNMTAEKRLEATGSYTQLLEESLQMACQNFDMLILDEAISACNHGCINEAQIINFLQTKPASLEVILTGRAPSQTLCSLADYITEMKKEKHPFDRGITARKGIEF